MSIMRRLVSVIAKRKAQEVEHLLNNQLELMDDKLMSILKRHRDTVYGRRFGFDAIDSPDQYIENIPLMDSKTHGTWLKHVYENPKGAILTADDVTWYLQTSGTSGKPKRLPVTKFGLKEVSKGSMMGWMGFLSLDPENTKLVEGKMITLGAPAVMDHINGVPVGYATGVYASHMNPMFQRLIRPGMDTFNITDMDTKMWEYAKIMTECNPTALQGISTLSLALLRRLQGAYAFRLREQYKGTKHEAKLLNSMNDDGTMDLSSFLPNLRLFVATGIDTDPYREWISKTLPEAIVWEMYGASEGFYGAQLLPEPGLQLTTNLDYFEFIPEKECEKLNPEAIPLSEVKKGNRYEMVMTNHQGYYRYRPGDMMTFSSTDPYTVRNIGRRGRIVNLSGEKISEAHVSNAITYACKATGAEVIDYSVVGIVEDGLPHYVIAAMFRDYNIDPVEFVMAYEDNLRENNEEFRIVRDMNALGPTVLLRMRTSFFENIAETVHIQAKPIPLTTDEKVLALCEPY